VDRKQRETLRFEVGRHQMAQVAVVIHDQEARFNSLCQFGCAGHGASL
jgi:hypothetical protein